MSSALLIGAGGLGCSAAIGLAAGGVRLITIIDDDRVDATNLARQVLFGDADVGEPKALVAARALKARYGDIDVRPQIGRFERDDASLQLVAGHDVVVDGTDNFATRFAANDLCVKAGVPLIHGAAIRWVGQLLTIVPGKTPCLRCVFESEPPPGAAPTCAEAGVIAPIVGVVGAWMAQAALDVLAGRTPESAGAMRVIDGWAGSERLVRVGRDPECPVCGVA